MVIGLEVLLERVRKGELITRLSLREMNSPEGAGFDLRVGEIYRIMTPGYLGISERETPDVELIASSHNGNAVSAVLQPGEYYLAKIMEEINLDDDMVGIFHPRSTLFRSGVVLQTGVHSPGYRGAPVFGLYVAGPHTFRLEIGARIAHINILHVEGGSSPYRGQWQGGRVTTEGLEEQV